MKRFFIPLVCALALAAVPSTAVAWPPNNGTEPVCVSDGHGGYTLENLTEDQYANSEGSIWPVPPEGCPAPPPPEAVEVCRNGEVISIPKGTEQPGDTPPPCAVAPPPQTTTPPPPQPETPPVTTVPDTPPVETPPAPDTEEKGDTGGPDEVRGEEDQDTPKKFDTGGSAPPAEATPTGGDTLPFTGSPLLPLALAGAALLGGGFWFRRWLTTS